MFLCMIQIGQLICFSNIFISTKFIYRYIP